MTVQKFVDELIDLDKIENKYDYAEAYCKFMIKHMIFSTKNYLAIKKEIEKRKSAQIPDE